MCNILSIKMQKTNYAAEAQQPLLQNQQQYQQQPPPYTDVYDQEPAPTTVIVPTTVVLPVAYEVGVYSPETTTGFLLFIGGCFFPLVWLFAPCFFHPKTQSGRIWRVIMIILGILSLISLLIIIIMINYAATNVPSIIVGPPSSRDRFPHIP